MVTRPAPLAPGARVALLAPAGPVTPDEVERAVERVAGWGWEPVLGTYARGRLGYLAESDENRLADLNDAIRDPDIEAVWCLRGGYGTLRIVDRVDWKAWTERPRPLIGFSDNTVLHLASLRYGVGSYHGPHPTPADLPPFTESLLLATLRGKGPRLLPFPPGGPDRARELVPGVAEGRLVGGNLSLIAATLGTPFQPELRGAILFLEEVGEPPYRIDRLLTQLRLAGALERVAGVALGAFSQCGEEDELVVAGVLADRFEELGVPAAYGFPFGHVAENWTLPVGAAARLDVGAGTLEILAPEP